MTLDFDHIPGSKASSPVETPKVSWEFLNFSHPNQQRQIEHRKKVRSHVTKQQHQREQALTAARRTNSYQPTTDTEELPPQRAHASTTPSNRPNLAEISAGRQQPMLDQTNAKSPSPSPSPTTNSPEIRADLNDLYPEEWHPYVPRILVSSTLWGWKQQARTLLTRARIIIYKTWQSTFPTLTALAPQVF